MAAGQVDAFKVVALVFCVRASLLTFFGLLRLVVSDITDEIAVLQQEVAALKAVAKPAEYYQDINKRLTVSEIKIEACLL